MCGHYDHYYVKLASLQKRALVQDDDPCIGQRMEEYYKQKGQEPPPPPPHGLYFFSLNMETSIDF